MDQQCAVVANATMLEVFRTSLVNSATEQRIEFTKVLLVELSDLPLHLIGRLESLQFDLYDKNVFYAIGKTNDEFEQPVIGDESEDCEEMAANGLRRNRPSERQGNQFRIEKFFIDCEETFQSQTMCVLQLPMDDENNEPLQDDPFANIEEDIIMYQNSQGHDLVAVVTNK